MDFQSRQQLSGYFENYVNMNCSPTSTPMRSKVMQVVTASANALGMTCAWAGSVKKKTFVSDYSDNDIWVETHSHGPVSEMERLLFAAEVKGALELLGAQVEVHFKPLATTFHVDDEGFDVVFSASAWTSTDRAVQPTNIDFLRNLNRQRAVKALKILSKNDLSSFPKISGMRLERLAIAASLDVDNEYGNHVEYASGLLLFRTCLFHFVLSPDASALVQMVSEKLPPACPGDLWVLKQNVFRKWQHSACYILASIHELRILPASRFSREDFDEAMKLSPAKLERPFLIDELNRVVFTM